VLPQCRTRGTLLPPVALSHYARCIQVDLETQLHPNRCSVCVFAYVCGKNYKISSTTFLPALKGRSDTIIHMVEHKHFTQSVHAMRLSECIKVCLTVCMRVDALYNCMHVTVYYCMCVDNTCMYIYIYMYILYTYPEQREVFQVQVPHIELHPGPPTAPEEKYRPPGRSSFSRTGKPGPPTLSNTTSTELLPNLAIKLSSRART
jgi:hypothetical protein